MSFTRPPASSPIIQGDRVSGGWAKWFQDEARKLGQAVGDLASLTTRVSTIETERAAEIDYLAVPDRSEDTVTYFYFGWEDVGGSWLVQRQDRVSSISLSATQGYDTLSEAWPNRNSLDYS